MKVLHGTLHAVQTRLCQQAIAFSFLLLKLFVLQVDSAVDISLTLAHLLCEQNPTICSAVCNRGPADKLDVSGEVYRVIAREDMLLILFKPRKPNGAVAQAHAMMTLETWHICMHVCGKLKRITDRSPNTSDGSPNNRTRVMKMF